MAKSPEEKYNKQPIPSEWLPTLKIISDEKNARWQEWLMQAESFKSSAIIVFNHLLENPKKETTPYIHYYHRIAMMLMGYAIELLLKTILIKQSKANQETHDLIELTKSASVKLNQEEVACLANFTQWVIWAGKYPTPKVYADLARASMKSSDLQEGIVIYDRIFKTEFPG